MSEFVKISWFGLSISGFIVSGDLKKQKLIISTNDNIKDNHSFVWVPSSIYNAYTENSSCYKIIPHVFDTNVSYPIKDEEAWIKDKIKKIPFDLISEKNIEISLKIFETMILKKISKSYIDLVLNNIKKELYEIKKEKESKWIEYKEFQLSQLPF